MKLHTLDSEKSSQQRAESSEKAWRGNRDKCGSWEPESFRQGLRILHMVQQKLQLSYLHTILSTWYFCSGRYFIEVNLMYLSPPRPIETITNKSFLRTGSLSFYYLKVAFLIYLFFLEEACIFLVSWAF